MRKHIFSLLIIAGLLHPGYAQESVVERFGEMISSERLKENLTVIASDSMEGRETGTRGQKMAAEFIREYFKSLNLTAPVDDYFQRLNLYRTSPGDTYVETEKKRYHNQDQVLYYGQANSGGVISTQLIYAGLGREEDYSNLDIKDKAVLIRIDDRRLYNLPEVVRARDKGAKMVFIWNTENESDFAGLINQAKIFQNNSRIGVKKPYIRTADESFFIVSPAIVGSLMNCSTDLLKKTSRENSGKNALQTIEPVAIKYKTEMAIEVIETENVLGFLEGTDKKDEVIVITAHYDHVGVSDAGKGDVIYNGADDDGSGTVAVMELARVFSDAKKAGYGPRRSLLFMTFTGEEKGLLGSAYYTQYPVLPLSQTVVDLNIDMIGRRDADHTDSKPYVYIIGSDKISSELHRINEAMNKKYCGLIFDYKYNDESHPSRLYYRSDHWNFAKDGVPIIFFFDGIHEDYHKPSDEVEKIEFDLLRKRTQCVFYTAWEIANRDQRIKVDSSGAN